MAELQDFAYTGNEIMESITTETAVTRTITADGETIVTLKAEPFNGQAVIRYDAIARNLFSEDREEVSVSEGSAYIDHQLQAYITAGGDGFCLVRGVAQYGESEVAPAMKFLTTMPYLVCYRNSQTNVAYEHLVSIAVPTGEDPASIVVDGSTYISSVTGLTNKSAVISFDFSSLHGYANTYIMELFTIAWGGRTLDSKTWYTRPIPTHPFYVRWINRLGGYDYIMLSCKHKRTSALTSVSTYERDGARGAQTTISKEGNEQVQASTGIVDIQTLKAVSEMRFSPDVRWYNESTNEWVPIQPTAESSEWMNDQPTGELTITFQLPNKQIAR